MEGFKGGVTRGITLKLVSILLLLVVICIPKAMRDTHTAFKLGREVPVINYAGQMRYRSYQLALQVNGYPALQ
ncbi:MAG TPA: hypothetical protein ACFYEA_03440, partial [Candidatus Tripitaka californicus]|uniref:hypothetical protein n=2 Tax=Candidatus Tripitaka californicus TaxID=3367616 RepID=UPI00402A334C